MKRELCESRARAWFPWGWVLEVQGMSVAVAKGMVTWAYAVLQPDEARPPVTQAVPGVELWREWRAVEQSNSRWEGWVTVVLMLAFFGMLGVAALARP